MHSKSQAQKISVRNKDSAGSWIKGLVYYPLAGNLSIFLPCPETLWNSEIKDRKEINLGEKFQENLTFKFKHALFCWLLLARFIMGIMNKRQKRTNLKNLNFGP